MKAIQAIPAQPVTDIERSVAFYRDVLGFPSRYQEDGFAIVVRDGVEISLWLSNDESWRTRATGKSPVCTGAESFIAGTASCRVQVDGVLELFASVQPSGAVHPNGGLRDTPYGTREFSVRDPDGNLVTFFEKISR